MALIRDAASGAKHRGAPKRELPAPTDTALLKPAKAVPGGWAAEPVFIDELRFDDPAARVTAYLPEGTHKPALIVLPGGGYQVSAPIEAAPVAARFAALGYAAFLLKYSTLSDGAGHTAFPEPLRQVAATVAFVRANSARFGIDPTRIALTGASAGGHLAACYCGLWNTPLLCSGGAEAEGLRPNACVLLYGATELTPGLMMLEPMYGHAAPYTAAELDAYTPEKLLGPQTPPTILFHSAPDPTIPAVQSQRLFAALQARGIPSELHIFGSGGHGYGLGAGTPMALWPELADNFLNAVWAAPERFRR